MSKCVYSSLSSYQGKIYWTFPPRKIAWGKRNRTSLMRGRVWIGVVRQQSITWANIDPDRCHHMASLNHNELSILTANNKNNAMCNFQPLGLSVTCHPIGTEPMPCSQCYLITKEKKLIKISSVVRFFLLVNAHNFTRVCQTDIICKQKLVMVFPLYTHELFFLQS